jgi:hypothetical protein
MASTSTKPHDAKLDGALSTVPSSLRSKLIEKYLQLKAAYAQSTYDSCGLRAGHFAEIMIRVLQHYLTGSYTPLGQKISNFSAECLRLENLPASAGAEGLRLMVPRALNFLYTLRNKRGIGHVGGDIDANEIDAATLVRLADWCVCELVRVAHSLSLEDAQAIVDSVAVRQQPQVWTVGGRRRVLNNSLDFRSKTLLLLYNESEPSVPAEDLFYWTEYSNFSVFKRDVLGKLHSARLVEYDRDTEMVTLSPLGAREVEEKLTPLAESQNGRH